jgi:hypothetical protein
VGGKGSGRTKESRLQQKYEGAAAGLQTPETREFHQAVRRQMADRMFEVHRSYPSGKKAFVGTVGNSRLDTLGKMFGAGEYELHEVDRGTGEATNRTPLRRILHPGKYPLRPEYAKDPMDAELAAAPLAPPAHVAALAGGPLGSLTPEQIYEKAKADALGEMQRQQEIKELRDGMARLEAALAARPAADSQASSMAQLRDTIGLVKELMPPPVPNFNTPLTPTESVRQGVEAIRLFQTELKGLGLDLGGTAAKAENPALLKLIDALQNIATSALPSLAAPRPLPVQRAAVPMPAVLAGAAAAGAAAPAPAGAATPAPAAAAPAAPAPAGEDQRLTMLLELSERLRADQAAQLQNPPQSHINSTVQWIRARMADPAAGAVWNNLPNVLGAFSESAVLEYIAGQAPDLVDTPPKRAWLASLVELLKAKS